MVCGTVALICMLSFGSLPQTTLSGCAKIIALISELLFLKKIWSLIAGKNSNFCKKQTLFISICVLVCFLPPVLGTKGCEIEWAQQSMFVDITNLCSEVAVDYLSKKKKTFDQVSFTSVVFKGSVCTDPVATPPPG